MSALYVQYTRYLVQYFKYTNNNSRPAVSILYISPSCTVGRRSMIGLHLPDEYNRAPVHRTARKIISLPPLGYVDHPTSTLTRTQRARSALRNECPTAVREISSACCCCCCCFRSTRTSYLLGLLVLEAYTFTPCTGTRQLPPFTQLTHGAVPFAWQINFGSIVSTA